MTKQLDKLTFGTDGWRDVIAERFTFFNVARVAQALALQLRASGGGSVLVGYDTRFLSARFARHVAEVLAGNGLTVGLSADYLPTPALSFAVKRYGADAGVMITASHNPAEWGGFKLKGSYGGTASDETYRAVAELVPSVGKSDVAVYEAARHSFEPFDVSGDYYDALAELVDLDAIARAGAPLLHDAMGGAGAGWLAAFFRREGLPDAVRELRGHADPMFYGVNPEPIPANLAATMNEMTASSPALFAVATDGDADRLGVVLPGGSFFNSHQIFAVLLSLLEAKGQRGTVVKTFTVSRIVERLAAARRLPVMETKVGFKYITDAMLAGGVLIGGEESGGIGLPQHLPERDGLANALLLLESVASSGVSLAEQFAALERETAWRHAYDRRDLRLGGVNAMKHAQSALDDAPTEVAGRVVTSVERLDGVKLNLADDAWVLVRASGTEPLLRVYCEAPDDVAVEDILAATVALLDGGT